MTMIQFSVIVLLIAFIFHYNTDRYVLYVCPYDDEYLYNYYHNYKTSHKGDSGVDIVISYNGTLLPKTYTKINHNVSFVLTKINNIMYYILNDNMYKSYSYYLYARSSLSTIPLIMPNGVGIIDAGYRGKLSTIIYNPNEYNITFMKGDKYTQICADDLSEIIVKINCDMPDYGTRGMNGFGSTS
jgi:dUTPase